MGDFMTYLFKKYSKKLISYFIVCILLSMLIVGDSFLLQFIVSNSFEGSKNFSVIFVLVISFVILQSIGYFLQGYLSEKIIKSICADLRENIFFNIFNKNGLSNDDNDISNEIIALTSQMENFESCYLNTILWGTYLFCQFIVAIIASLIIKPVFVIIILVLSIPSVLVAIFSKKVVSEHRKNVILNQETFISKTVDYIQGSKNIIYFNSFDTIYKHFVLNKQKLLISQINSAKVNAKVDMLNKFSSALLYYGIWLVGSYFIIVGSMNLAQIIAFTQLVTSIAFPLHMVLNLTSDFYSGKEIKNYLNNYIDFYSKREENTKIDIPKEIAIKSLNFSMDNRVILENINLSINLNNKYALLGESGSGKSTFVNLLLNENLKFSGDILIDDLDIRKVDRAKLFENIGYFPQKNYIFNDNIRNNLSMFDKNIEDKYIIDIIEKVGLGNWFENKTLEYNISENSFDLSGGERQRFLLARLLVRKYKFLILDEIFTGLDIENLTLIESILKNLNIGFLLITHNYNKILDYVDTTLEIKNGNIFIKNKIK